MSFKAIDYDPDRKTLSILDQLLLPHDKHYLPIQTVEDAFRVIRAMNVRGAPAIAIVAMLSLAVEINSDRSRFDSKQGLEQYVVDKAEYLCTSRPTAVNIRKESDKLIGLTKTLAANSTVDLDQMITLVIKAVEDLLGEDLAVNQSIGDHGAKHFLSTLAKNRPLNILTICNTGSLATTGYGTALGVIRSLWKAEQLNVAYCAETRPYLQGARLTAWELVQDQINGCLICDNMVAALMKKGQVDGVVVGADRVVANGDTANKIGTYQMAVLAKYHQVPFYVASPLSTIDLTRPDGSQIPIEERPHNELKSIAGHLIAPNEINCWNPAFDVTPAELITGIITEKGVVKPENIATVFH